MKTNNTILPSTALGLFSLTLIASALQADTNIPFPIDTCAKAYEVNPVATMFSHSFAEQFTMYKNRNEKLPVFLLENAVRASPFCTIVGSSNVSKGNIQTDNKKVIAHYDLQGKSFRTRVTIPSQKNWKLNSTASMQLKAMRVLQMCGINREAYQGNVTILHTPGTCKILARNATIVQTFKNLLKEIME